MPIEDLSHIGQIAPTGMVAWPATVEVGMMLNQRTGKVQLAIAFEVQGKRFSFVLDDEQDQATQQMLAEVSALVKQRNTPN